MTKKTRFFIFGIFVIIFLIITPIIILYSLGWRFSFKDRKMLKTGVLYFKILPKNAQIYLNGNLKKKTDLFFGSALIENLSSKQYEIEIKKDGFYSWKKNLAVEENKATELKNILLIPQNPNFTSLSSKDEDFYFSPDEKIIILKEKEDAPGQEWALKLFDLDKNIKSYLVEEKDFLKQAGLQNKKIITNVDLINLKFSPDSKTIILETSIGETLKYWLLPIDTATPKLTQLDYFNISSIETVYFNPKNHQELFALDEEKLNKIDLVNKEISPAAKDIISFAILGDNVYYLKKNGLLYKTNLSFDSEEKLNATPLSIEKETEYKLFLFSNSVILKEKDSFYWFDKKERNFKKFNEGGTSINFSPDGRKLVYFTDYEIWILFLEKINEQPEKEAGQQLFLTRFSEKISNAFWYGNYYLIFNAGDKIKVAETDDRDRINIVDLTEYKNPKIFWSNLYKKLYILSEGNLYLSEKLISQY